ncbi:major facilitator superfamily domain-containing protein [Coemansia spiralis]|nr:major facilitator superfamily domain-containing protein [Coemansia spiralis]
MSPLKSTLKQELDINNTQWASLISMVWVVGTVSPFIAGLFIDTLGAPLAGAVSIALILIGNGLCAIAVGARKLSVFLVGRAIYSIGGGAVLLVGEVIILKWFKGRQLPVAFGCASTIGGIMAFSGPAAVTAILTKHGNVTVPFWLATGLSALGLACFTIYAFIHYSHYATDIELECCGAKQSKANDQDDNSTADSAIYSEKARYLTRIVPEMMETEWGYTRAESSKLFVYLHIIPIVLHITIGIFINRFGHRLSLFLAGSVLVYLASLFIAFVRRVPVMLSLVMINLSGSIVPASIFSLMNLVIDNGEVAGAALGLIRSAEFASVTLMEMLDGLLQDADHNHYDTVMIGLVVFACVLLLVAVASLVIDRCYGGGCLNSPDPYTTTTTAARKDVDISSEFKDVRITSGKCRVIDEIDKDESTQASLSNIPLEVSSLIPKRRYFYLGTIGLLLAAAWILFILSLTRI